MNLGFSPVEIANKVKLPPSIATHPYLQEHYGTIAWIVRNIYCGYFGWFSGTDVLELSNVLPGDRAARMVKMVGREKMRREAEQALEDGELWWSLEMTSHLLKDEFDEDVRKLYEKALLLLAEKQTSSMARSVFLTHANRCWDIKERLKGFQKVTLTLFVPALFTVLKVCQLIHSIRTPHILQIFQFLQRDGQSDEFLI